MLDTAGIATLLGVSTKHVRERLVHSADFPRPALALSRKMRRWDADDVQNWLDRQRKRQLR